MSQKNTQGVNFYKSRNPQSSPFYKLVDQYFDEFEQVYTQRYEKQYGFWRFIIRSSIDKFLKCGDLKEGSESHFHSLTSLGLNAKSVVKRCLLPFPVARDVVALPVTRKGL